MKRHDNYMPTPEQYVSSLPNDNDSSLREPQTLRRKRPPRRVRWRRIFGLTLLALVLAVVGYLGFIVYTVAKITTQPLDLTGLSADASGRTNILVLGIGDPGHAGEKLSDTMMVISLNSRTNQVAQISVPRDLRVDIPGYGSGKINSANVYGGVALAEQTVSNTLGIPINYYVQTDFTGLKQLIDAVGGIDVNVKERLTDTEYPCDNDQYKVCGLDILVGEQHMDGTRALQYVRCRKGTCGNDFGRAARQQEVINLVRQKVARPEVVLNPAKLIPVVTAVRNGITTDMGAVQMLAFVRGWQAAQAHQPQNLVLSTAPGGYLRGASSSSDLLPIDGDFTAIQSRVQDIFTAQ